MNIPLALTPASGNLSDCVPQYGNTAVGRRRISGIPLPICGFPKRSRSLRR